MNFLNKKIFSIISEQARLSDVRAFVIGGYVRDSLIGRKSKDIDIVVEGSGIELAKKVAEVIGTNVSVFKNFGTAMLRWKDLEIEFVGARKESYRANSRNPIVEDGSLTDDQLRRDFTINALAFSLQKEDYGALSDPFNGKEDLERKIIRTPLEPDTTYSDDPLRMLRAIRFATQLSFTIEPASLEAIYRNRKRLSILSFERINEEINKILLSPKPSVGFYLMDSTGILEKRPYHDPKCQLFQARLVRHPCILPGCRAGASPAGRS
ncbi:MAG: CCA tRNA nucleotidyltransferase, partial [Bacteroidia bacterium]|nr:CCA tRNA nucleotidyltransferase [Bacteroidia bacterium]